MAFAVHSYFRHQNRVLHAESVDLQELALKHGTPLYVYSGSAIAHQYRRYRDAFGEREHLVCYAVKANGNLAILKELAQMGCGFDVVSAGELRRVLKAGGDAHKVVFSGVGKTAEEMEFALESGILCFNVESAAELEQLGEVASAHGAVARAAIRVNPDIQAGAHPHIETGTHDSKFGVSFQEAEQLYLAAAGRRSIDVQGIDCHIGSQITDYSTVLLAIDHMLALVERLARHGIDIKHVDVGGGLGLSHSSENPYGESQIESFMQSVCARLPDKRIKIIVEPGRSLVAPAGLLLTKILYLKTTPEKNFAIVDTGMNHFLRPMLYNATHPIVPVKMRSSGKQHYDVVGTVCENADVLARCCPLAVKSGDILAICMAGAYGSSMSSNYNGLARAAEVLVQHAEDRLIRKRECPEDLWRNELVS